MDVGGKKGILVARSAFMFPIKEVLGILHGFAMLGFVLDFIVNIMDFMIAGFPQSDESVQRKL